MMAGCRTPARLRYVTACPRGPVRRSKHGAGDRTEARQGATNLRSLFLLSSAFGPAYRSVNLSSFVYFDPLGESWL
jgi:hypothetical protein